MHLGGQGGHERVEAGRAGPGGPLGGVKSVCVCVCVCVCIKCSIDGAVLGLNGASSMFSTPYGRGAGRAGGASAELGPHRHGAGSSLSARERAGAARKIENR